MLGLGQLTGRVAIRGLHAPVISEASCGRAEILGSFKVAKAVLILRQTFETPEPLVLWASARSRNLPVGATANSVMTIST